jgi:GTP-binding protein
MTWKIKDAEFLRAITRLADAPGVRPAAAFAGRSNVGKSSLINCLLGGRKLARTSSTPGCTRQIVYFDIDRRFYFIDLPGYGYAKAPKHEQTRWGSMMDD